MYFAADQSYLRLALHSVIYSEINRNPQDLNPMKETMKQFSATIAQRKGDPRCVISTKMSTETAIACLPQYLYGQLGDSVRSLL